MNERDLQALEAKEKKYKVKVDDGLFVVVLPSGKKTFVAKLRGTHINTEKVIGDVGALSLKQAKAAVLRLVDKHSIELFSKQDQGRTFEEVYESWVTMARRDNKWSDNHYAKVNSAFTHHVIPHIGHKKMGGISPQDIYAIIESMEAKGITKTVADVKTNLGRVFALGILKGDTQSDPSDVVRKLHRNPRKGKAGFPFLRAEDLGEFQVRLDVYQSPGVVKNATLLLMLTAIRTNELRTSRWEWVNWEERTMTVPASHMKGDAVRKTNEDYEHVVHLSDYAIKVLKEQQKVTGNTEYICFNPLSRKHPFISENAIREVIIRLGYVDSKGNMTHSGHGFRKSFSTAANENKDLFGANSKEAIEFCLAHVQDNQVEAAYNKASYHETRAKIMQWYGEYLWELKEKAGADPAVLQRVTSLRTSVA